MERLERYIDALLVNWLEVEISKPNGKVTYRNSFITDLAVTLKNSRRNRRQMENRERNLQCLEKQGL